MGGEAPLAPAIIASASVVTPSCRKDENTRLVASSAYRQLVEKRAREVAELLLSSASRILFSGSTISSKL